jgi:hypothetical protein
MSALEEARPQEGQKRASSADTAPQLEQLLMPWIVMSAIVRSMSNRQAVAKVSWKPSVREKSGLTELALKQTQLIES